ncbi:MAG: hypothetical protein IPP81_19225, partial [Chitinophagaceae bacterium]|nr:hypothetical protein [Chitinophagaceae bacterium]
MPEILQHGAMAFTDERERDVFSQVHWQFSAVLPGVKGVYAGNGSFPECFFICHCPRRQWKGALEFAKMLADEY